MAKKVSNPVVQKAAECEPAEVTELEKVESLLDSLEICYSVYIDQDLISYKAVDNGAVLCVSIRETVDLLFDKDGRLVGTETLARHSWSPRIK